MNIEINSYKGLNANIVEQIPITSNYLLLINEKYTNLGWCIYKNNKYIVIQDKESKDLYKLNYITTKNVFFTHKDTNYGRYCEIYVKITEEALKNVLNHGHSYDMSEAYDMYYTLINALKHLKQFYI